MIQCILLNGRSFQGAFSGARGSFQGQKVQGGQQVTSSWNPVKIEDRAFKLWWKRYTKKMWTFGNWPLTCSLFKVGWGSKCDSSHLWRRTLRSGVQKSRKLEILFNAYLHVAMDSTSILILTSSSRLCLRLFVNQANLDSGRRWLEIFHEVKTPCFKYFIFYRKCKCLC